MINEAAGRLRPLNFNFRRAGLSCAASRIKRLNNMSRKPFLLMQPGDVPEPLRRRHGNFDAMFQAAADFSRFEVKVVRVFLGEKLESHENYCGALVTGSPAMVTDGTSWSERMAVWLREAIIAGLPVLGVCYGHQLIARAFGGDVDFHPLGTELGTHQITLYPGQKPHPWLLGLPDSFPANQAHSQSVREIGGVNSDSLWRKTEEGAGSPCDRCQDCVSPRALACSGHDPHQIIAYGDKCLTLQFHPEFSAGIMSDYMEMHSGTGQVRLGEPVMETPAAAGILQRFLDSLE